MEYFFGRVPEKFREEEDFYFEKDGNHFYYKIVVDDEEDHFAIQDTCGRFIPFDREVARELGTAIFFVNQVYDALSEAKKIYNKKLNETLAIISHINNEQR